MSNSDTSKICFVVGPIGEDDSDVRIHSDWLLDEIIEPVISQIPAFQVERADKLPQPGLIDAQVIGRLLNADLVIADLSTLNPNAFYEIGIRHMAQKPIIHMHHVDERIPFDVASYRSIKFARRRPSDLKAARAALKQSVDAVLASGYRVENPVTKLLGAESVDLSPSNAAELIHQFARHRRVDIHPVSTGEQSSLGTRSFKAAAKDGMGAVYCHASGSRFGQVYYVRKGIALYYFRHMGGPASALGLPISNEELADDTGFPTSYFEHGLIDWSAKSSEARAIVMTPKGGQQLGGPAAV